MDQGLLTYIERSLRKKNKEEQIILSLTEKGWKEEIIRDAVSGARKTLEEEKTVPLIAPSPKKSLDISQVLLYLGGLIIILAGIIFIGINWLSWGSGARILAIFLPMAAMYAVGVPLWFGKRYATQSIVFIFTGSLLFPLFLSVFLAETKMFNAYSPDGLGLIISLSTFILYLALDTVFSSPVWSFLYPAAGLFVYHFALSELNISLLFGRYAELWAYLLPAFLCLILGYSLEKRGKMDDCKYPYLLGFAVAFFCLARLGTEGQLIGGVDRGSYYGFNYYAGQELIYWSSAVAGLIYLAIALLTEKAAEEGLAELGKYRSFFELVGIFFILGALFLLGVDGKKPFYETSLLLGSLGSIFISVPKVSRPFLYAGTLFLIIYIFDIGNEYFQNQVGWPLTLFVAGSLSMGIGFAVEKLKRRYFLNPS